MKIWYDMTLSDEEKEITIPTAGLISHRTVLLEDVWHCAFFINWGQTSESLFLKEMYEKNTGIFFVVKWNKLIKYLIIINKRFELLCHNFWE